MSYPHKYSRPGQISSRYPPSSSSRQSYGLHNEGYQHRQQYPLPPPSSSRHDVPAAAGIAILHPPDFNVPPPPYAYPSVTYKRPAAHTQSAYPTPLPHSYYPVRQPVKRPGYGNNFHHQPSSYPAATTNSNDRKFIAFGPSSRERHSDADPRNKYNSVNQHTQSNYSKEHNGKQYASSRSERTPSFQREYRDKDKRPETERDRLLSKWRSNYCETSEDIAQKLEQLANNEEKEYWIRSSPADVFYKRKSANEMEGTSRLEAVCKVFKEELVDRGRLAKTKQPSPETPSRKRRQRVCRHKCKTYAFN